MYNNPKDAKILVKSEQITTATQKLAELINNDYKDLNPIVLCVVKGAIPFTGHLLPYLNFELELDYILPSK